MEPGHTPCPNCARHVAAGEVLCVFCGAVLVPGVEHARPENEAERLLAPLYGAPPRAAAAPAARGPLARLLAWLRGR